MSWLSRLCTAQQVRLWFIAGCELLTLILLLVATSQLNYSPYFNVTVASGDTLGVVVWTLIAQVAVVTLAIITGYRLIHPKPKGVWVPTTGGETNERAPH